MGTTEPETGAGREDGPWGSAPAAAFGFMVAASATFKISTYDVWWHLAYGRRMFETWAIPRRDEFSFTAAGAERTDHEWLFQCLAYGLHRLGGPAALILAKAAVVAVAALLVCRFVRRETGLPAAAVALLLVPFVLAGHHRFVVRPDLLSLAFAVALAAALFRRRARPPAVRDLWWIPPLFALWANVHGGVIVGLVILALALAGRGIELLGNRWRGRRWVAIEDGRPSPRVLAVLLVGAFLGGLVNPFFHRVYLVSFHITSLHESGVFRNYEWVPPQWPVHWLYFAALAAAAVTVAARWRRPDAPAILVLLFFASISLRYVRNLAFFGFLAPLLLAAAIVRRGRGEPPPAWRDRFAVLRPGLVTACLLILGSSFLVANPRFANGLGVDERRLPVSAVDFLAAERPPGNLLNAHPFGGYAIWRLHPRQRVFIDGRDDIFADLRRRLGRAAVDSRRWSALLDEHRIGHTLLQYIERLEELRQMDPAGGPPRVVLRPYAVNHFPPREWALVYFDDVAMVHVRRVPEAATLIERHGYEHVYPENAGFQLEAIRLGWATREGAIRELEAKLDRDAGCARAHRLLAAVRAESEP